MMQNAKRIAVLGLTHPFRGGISHHSTLLVRQLRTRHDVTFVTLKRQYPEFLFPGKTQYDESANKFVEENDSIIDSINPFTWLKTALFLRRKKVELVVIQWWHPFFGLALGTIAHLLALVSRARVCFLCHNVAPHESTVVDRILTSYAFLTARHFVVHSRSDREKLLSLKPTAFVRKTLHPTYAVFGPSDAYEKEQARRELNLSDRKRVLLFFGLVRQYKGLKYLLHAMGEVSKTTACTLLVVGEFYEPKKQYEELIRELGLEDRIILVDRYVKNEEVPVYFCAADAVVLPYVEATQSGIIQIAFAFNTPAITTDAGGLPEAVEDGKTGFVVRTRSSADLARAITRYYREGLEGPFREEISQRKDKFSWEHEVTEIEGFVRETHEYLGTVRLREGI